MRSKRAALLVVVVLGLVLAGCTSGTTGTDATNGPPDAATVKSDAIAAMDDAQTYQVKLSADRHLEANLERNVSVEFTKRIDRQNEELAVNQTASARGRSSVTKIYLVNRTVYQHNDAFARRYNSEWISVDVSDNFSRTWSVLDTLSRHRQILNRSSVSLNGTETVDGTKAYVLELHPDESEIQHLMSQRRGAKSGGSASRLNVTNAAFTYWIDVDSNRPVKVSGTLNTTVDSPAGTLVVNKSFVFHYDGYGTDVSVTLPDGAKEEAVPFGGRLSPDVRRSAARVRPIAVG